MLHNVCPDLCSVWRSYQKSEAVCRFKLSDFIENHVVHDGHRPKFRTHVLFSFFMHIVIGSARKSGSVWSLVVKCMMASFSHFTKLVSVYCYSVLKLVQILNVM